MITKVFGMFDSAVGEYNQPIFAPSEGAVVRSFSDAVNGKDGQMSNHPEDFTLFELGRFDSVKGLIVCLEAPRRIVCGRDLILKK